VHVIKISFEMTDEPARLIVTELMPYPLATVWLAETEALYVQRWWAPADYENTAIELASEVGGPWRVVQRDPQGNQFALYGKVLEVVPEAKLMFALTSEIFPDATVNVMQEFAARGVGTVVVSTYSFGSENDLKNYLALGGVDRLRGASARLDALLAQLSS
jgi:uncharacterized protein YndB with AHSA1/START domain